MRDYSQWEGVPPRTRAHLHSAGLDTEAVMQEIEGSS